MRTRIIVFLILIVFFSVSIALGQDFYVKSIAESHQTVVIGENGASKEWTVQKGDKVEGWTVVDIQPDEVVMRSEPDEWQLMVRQVTLPVNNSIVGHSLDNK